MMEPPTKEKNDIPALIEEEYRKYLTEKRLDIVRRISQADDVACELLEAHVLSDRDHTKIQARPMSRQKAEALFQCLLKTSFKHIKVVIEAFKNTHNKLAADYLKAILNQIKTQEGFNENWLENKSECSISSSSAGGSTEGPLSSSSSSSGSSSDEDTHPGEVKIEMTTLRLEVEERETEKDVDETSEIVEEDDTKNGITGSECVYNEDISSLKSALQNVRSIADLIAKNEEEETPLHEALYYFDDEDSCKAIKMIVARFEELEGSMVSPTEGSDISLAEFVNQEDEDGQTALHVAIQSRDIASVQLLYRTYGADIFIQNQDGQTALEMMYTFMPKEVDFILDSAVTACVKSNKTGKMIIGADFSVVLGKKEAGKTDDFSKNNLTFLANVVNTNSRRQRLYLSHPLITLFMMIQWRRYKEWILASAVMQILLKLFYGLFVGQVFLVSCPYDFRSEEQNEGNTTTLNGTETSNESYKNTSPPRRVAHCQAPIELIWLILGGILAFFAGFLILHEFFELFYKIKAALRWMKKDDNEIMALFSGVRNYFSELENVLQLLCASLILFTCLSVFDGDFTELDYSIASASIILGSILVLVELGSFPWFSVYIQILFKVAQSFAKFLALYAVLILAFSMSFCITFPKEKAFQSFLVSIPRMIIMMSGEIEYREIVYNSDDDEPKIMFMGQIIFASFTIIMAFILTNLLIGLVVSDVKELTEKAQVVAMSVTLERCYTMANTLRLRYWRWILLPLSRLIKALLWFKRWKERQAGGEIAALDAERDEYELEPFHTMKLGPDSRIAMLQLPESLQGKLEELIKRVPGVEDK